MSDFASVLTGAIVSHIVAFFLGFFTEGLAKKMLARWKRWKLRRKKLGRSISRKHLKLGGMPHEKVHEWKVYNDREDVVRPDSMRPRSFTVWAILLASHLDNSNGWEHTGVNTKFKFTARRHSQKPSEMLFAFVNDSPCKLDDEPYLQIQFDDEETEIYPLDLPPESPRDWPLYKEDNKKIGKALRKHSRMTVRWFQFNNESKETVTAEFNLEGWDEVYERLTAESLHSNLGA